MKQLPPTKALKGCKRRRRSKRCGHTPNCRSHTSPCLMTKSGAPEVFQRPANQKRCGNRGRDHGEVVFVAGTAKAAVQSTSPNIVTIAVALDNVDGWRCLGDKLGPLYFASVEVPLLHGLADGLHDALVRLHSLGPWHESTTADTTQAAQTQSSCRRKLRAPSSRERFARLSQLVGFHPLDSLEMAERRFLHRRVAQIELVVLSTEITSGTRADAPRLPTPSRQP